MFTLKAKLNMKKSLERRHRLTSHPPTLDPAIHNRRDSELKVNCATLKNSRKLEKFNLILTFACVNALSCSGICDSPSDNALKSVNTTELCDFSNLVHGEKSVNKIFLLALDKLAKNFVRVPKTLLGRIQKNFQRRDFPRAKCFVLQRFLLKFTKLNNVKPTSDGKQVKR
jgi:hypothetical protein